MTQIMVCAHPWQLLQAKQTLWYADGDKVTPALYHCPICKKTKSEGDSDPRIVIGRMEEEK